MKKSLIFAGILIIGIFAGFLCCMSVILGQKEDIRVWHQVLEGDISEAEGLQLGIKTHWTDRLYWDTELTMDADTVAAYKEVVGGLETNHDMLQSVPSKTTFSTEWAMENQTKWTFESSYWDGSPISIRYGGSYSATYSGGLSEEKLELEYMDYKEAILAVAKRTKAGEMHTEEVTLADYMEYYPIMIEFGIEGKNLYLSSYDQGNDVIADYLGIKIPKNHKMTITIGKNEAGKITYISTEEGNGYAGSASTGGASISSTSAESENGGAIQLNGVGLGAEDGFYFAFYGMDEQAKMVKLESKAGPGIYFIPITEGADADFTNSKDYWTVHYEKITKVLELPEGVMPLEIRLDDSGKNMLLLSNEADSLVLRVMDIEAKKEIQKLELMPYTLGGSYRQTDITEHGILTILNNGDFVLYKQGKEGYTVKASGNLGVAPRLDSHLKWHYALDYKDGRLAFICALDVNESGLLVNIFDETGLKYRGHYIYSGSMENQLLYQLMAGLQQENPLTIVLP